MKQLSSLLCATVFVGFYSQCNADIRQVETPTDCDSIAVVVGQRAAITCRFGRDISKSKHNIDVQLYPQSSHEPESILKCNWLVRKPDEPTCTVRRGCIFNASVTDTLTIEITKVTKDFEGDYICQLFPSDGILARECRLTVIDSTQEDQGITKNDTVTSNNDVKLPEGTRMQSNVLVIVAGFVGVVGIPRLIINCVYLFLRFRKRKIKNSRRKREIAQAAPESKAKLVESDGQSISQK